MDSDFIKNYFAKKGHTFDDDMGLGAYQLALFEEVAEQHLWNPTYIIDYPMEVSPLARASDSNPEITERCELFIAGREIANGFSELNDNCAAYGTKGHRHQPEMAQELNFLSENKIKVLFTPHLVSMTRGILGTNYATLKKEIKEKDVVDLYKEFYKNEPFIKIVDTPPATKHTWGSNFVYLYPYVREDTNTLVVISALDNLVKGSAGAAIQNMNLMQGFEETMGIGALPIYP